MWVKGVKGVIGNFLKREQLEWIIGTHQLTFLTTPLMCTTLLENITCSTSTNRVVFLIIIKILWDCWLDYKRLKKSLLINFAKLHISQKVKKFGHSNQLSWDWKQTSPLPEIGSLSPIASHLLLRVPPPSPLGATSFLDGPLTLIRPGFLVDV